MASLHRYRVFVAEDDDELRAVLAAVFRRDGYDVIEAIDGPDLVEHLVRARISGHPLDNQDVVVSDIRMPGVTGLQVLASFHNLHWNTPIILISGFADEETEAHARQLGAAAVFSKPFDVDDLRAAVSNLVGIT
jgi:two-component system response regulator (stage 0 sporulation protein F)